MQNWIDENKWIDDTKEGNQTDVQPAVTKKQGFYLSEEGVANHFWAAGMQKKNSSILSSDSEKAALYAKDIKFSLNFHIIAAYKTSPQIHPPALWNYKPLLMNW